MAKTAGKGGEHGHGHGAAPHDDHHGGGDGHDSHGGGHCPPPWILTFADMSVLLMAFFVIMLMSANTDVPKFNAFAAVMRQTFGRAPIDPNDADKGGTSILDLHFGPQSGEQTNDPPGAKPQSGDPERPADNAEGGGGVDEAAEALAKAMRDAVAQGELTVEGDSGKVVVRLPEGTGAEAAQKIADAIAAAAAEGEEGSPDAPLPSGGAEGAEGPAPSIGQDGAAADEESEGADPAGSGRGVIRAKLAAIKAGMLLQAEMAEGSVDIEQRDGSVVVTVGAGGAFTSGSADLTEEAQAIIANLRQVSDKARRIVITGHTDNVPLSGGQYRDNWDLASARAGSVLRAIEQSGVLPDAELVAQSKGETEPLADNATPEGREKNRRIEIEIEFDEE